LRRLPGRRGPRTACGGYGIDDLIRSARVSDEHEARYMAAGWLLTVLGKGSFELLDSVVETELQLLKATLEKTPAPPTWHPTETRVGRSFKRPIKRTFIGTNCHLQYV